MTLQQPIALQFSVAAQRQEVMFKDGTHIHLHPVFERGAPCLFKRAIHLKHNVTVVVDLRELVPQLGADLCVAQARDVPGIVFYSLRHAYSTAELVVRQISLRGTPLVERTEREAA